MTLFLKLQTQFPALRLLNGEPMANHTSFRIGGPTLMACPSSREEMTELYHFCLEEGVSPLILGAGTNVLAPDEGLNRLVICTKELSQIRDMGDGMIEADCGVPLARLACFARDLGLTGLEFSHGIPGTVGGGVYMNAGAYGGEMCQVVKKTTALMPDGSLEEIQGKGECFGYRRSIFAEKKAVILKAAFGLRPGNREEITAKMKELMEKRKASQPLEMPSAGSTFKRPATGYAAALIDEAGLKGQGVGRAAVSTKHAGFVVNLGGATAADVKATMAMVQIKVKEQSGVTLEPEVRIW